jgi:hypothetical protein
MRDICGMRKQRSCEPTVLSQVEKVTLDEPVSCLRIVRGTLPALRAISVVATLTGSATLYPVSLQPGYRLVLRQRRDLRVAQPHPLAQ